MSFKKKPKTIDPDKVDPSVYYYDEVYDEMKDEEKPKSDSARLKDKDKGSKYIEGLKETAELRKAEKELRKFRKYASDREEAAADGSSSQDVYITPAYKQKLDEMKRLEEEKMKRLELEKDNSMNFLKNSSVPKKYTDKKQTIGISVPCNSKHDLNKSDGEAEIPGENTSSETATIDKTIQSNRPAKRKLDTLEERREYLRQLLVKRTVGMVYEEAVKRYAMRKALMQR